MHNVWEMWWEWRADQKFPNTIFLFWQEDTKLDRGQHHLLYHHHHQLKWTARQKTGKQFGVASLTTRQYNQHPSIWLSASTPTLRWRTTFLCVLPGAWYFPRSSVLQFCWIKTFFLQYCYRWESATTNSAFTQLQDNKLHGHYLLGVPCGECEVPANFHDELSVSKTTSLATCYTYLYACGCTESKFEAFSVTK